MPKDRYTLAYVASSPGDAVSFNFGTRFTDGYLGFFPPGAENESFDPAGSVRAIFSVSVDDFHVALERYFPDIPEALLRHGAAMRVGKLEQTGMRQLLNGIDDLVAEWRSGNPAPFPCRRMRDEVMPAYFAALRSGCESLIPLPSSRTSRRFARIRKAREYFTDRIDEPVTMEDLCRELNLSERGVQCLFQELVGVSPTSYLKHQRLGLARRKLELAGRESGAVKRAAIESGCWHLGRFSRDYRTKFGELPTETLKRQTSSKASLVRPGAR